MLMNLHFGANRNDWPKSKFGILILLLFFLKIKFNFYVFIDPSFHLSSHLAAPFSLNRAFFSPVSWSKKLELIRLRCIKCVQASFPVIAVKKRDKYIISVVQYGTVAN